MNKLSVHEVYLWIKANNCLSEISWVMSSARNMTWLCLTLCLNLLSCHSNKPQPVYNTEWGLCCTQHSSGTTTKTSLSNISMSICNQSKSSKNNNVSPQHSSLLSVSIHLLVYLSVVSLYCFCDSCACFSVSVYFSFPLYSWIMLLEDDTFVQMGINNMATLCFNYRVSIMTSLLEICGGKKTITFSSH